MARLSIENLSKQFPANGRNGPVVALEGLSWEVPEGKLVALLGPSGCGKTTLLRLVAGLEHADSGDIRLDGRSLRGVRPQDRSVAMAFQFPALLPQLSVGENIALGPRLRGERTDEISRRLTEVANLLQISDLLGRFPETLSGGQQQRVALGRALANRPSLLLLDEPLANLDPTSRHELREAIRDVQKRTGVTTIYVTHDQAEAAAIGDQIAVMHRGVIEQSGAPAEIYRAPKNLFIAEFFSPERPNTFAAEIRGGHLYVGSVLIDVPPANIENGAVTCLIRAFAIRPGGALEAKVEDFQHTGWSTRIVLSHSILTLRTELPYTPELIRGATFSFRIDPAGVLFFDRATGIRL